MTARTFSLRDILTVTTDRLLTKNKDGGNGIGNLYELLNYMTGDSLFTHVLPRAGDWARPHVLSQVPEVIEDVDLTALDKCLHSVNLIEDREVRFTAADAAIEQWLTDEKLRLGLEDSYELTAPENGWTGKHPLRELQEMIPAKKIITVIHDRHDPSERQ